jgi:1-deoxy-D-xylulose-5-phosphate synthase
LRDLAKEIRQEIIRVVGKNGGHLASNLGVVELTLALHRVFDSPKDAIVWDVGHQSYTHKILTGRLKDFDSLRMPGGLSGFTKQSESPHDYFDVGHSSTSISSALGLLVGRKMLSVDGKVIALIGDGALTGGMALEALSHAGQIGKNLVVVLNDNQMSIDKNTGSLSRYLSRLTMTSHYQSFRNHFDAMIEKIPLLRSWLPSLIFRTKRAIKALVFSNNLFSDLGFEYVGPFNGHSIPELERVFSRVKHLKKPVVVHVLTQKGRGYSPAESDPTCFHGLGPFCIEDGSQETNTGKTFTQAFSESLLRLAEENPKIVAITAAMMGGTGLTEFAKRYPDRFFDVGIAEQHAVTFAGGLSVAGLKPVVAIYSTFMQRALDQLIQDISIQKIPAIFVLDRSGPVPDDGETHQGIFDISLMRPIPNLSLLAPASAKELDLMMTWAQLQNESVIIRYPKAVSPEEIPAFGKSLEPGRGVFISYEEILLKERKKTSQKENLFVTTGGMIPEVFEAVSLLSNEGIECDVYNLRFLKPLDKTYFIDQMKSYNQILFVEDGIRIGGIGTYLESLLQRNYIDKKTAVCGFPNRYFAQGKRKDILEDAHLSPRYLAKKMLRLFEVQGENIDASK